MSTANNQTTDSIESSEPKSIIKDFWVKTFPLEIKRSMLIAGLTHTDINILYDLFIDTSGGEQGRYSTLSNMQLAYLNNMSVQNIKKILKKLAKLNYIIVETKTQKFKGHLKSYRKIYIFDNKLTYGLNDDGNELPYRTRLKNQLNIDLQPQNVRKFFSKEKEVTTQRICDGRLLLSDGTIFEV